MSHFWLNPDEQALMDSATSTAVDYGYIGAFDIGTNTKVALKKMLGYEARPEDQIRPHKLVARTKFHIPAARDDMSVKALVRVSKAQALLLKMSVQKDSITQRLIADPTGEYWGNLLIAQNVGNGWGGRNEPFASRYTMSRCIHHLVADHGFGPTLDFVGEAADALPESWRAAFVMEFFEHWYRAKDESRYSKDGKFAPLILKGLFSEPNITNAQAWANQFWNWCQKAEFRKKKGIED